MYARTRASGFGAEVKRRIMVGTYTYLRDTTMLTISKPKVRTLIKQDFETAFEQVDVLVCPTVPTTAFKVGKNSDP